MFQQPSLFPWLTVEANAALGLRFTGRKKEAPELVDELLRLVDLKEFAKRNVQDLSVRAPHAAAVRPDTFTRSTLQRDVR